MNYVYRWDWTDPLTYVFARERIDLEPYRRKMEDPIMILYVGVAAI